MAAWPLGRPFFGPNSPKLPLTGPKVQKWPKISFLGTFIEKHSSFGESNAQSVIASFCLVFRAFLQINSTASWPTVPPPLTRCAVNSFMKFNNSVGIYTPPIPVSSKSLLTENIQQYWKSKSGLRTYLIFVTGTTGGTRGEKSVMWRNLTT